MMSTEENSTTGFTIKVDRVPTREKSNNSIPNDNRELAERIANYIKGHFGQEDDFTVRLSFENATQTSECDDLALGITKKINEPNGQDFTTNYWI